MIENKFEIGLYIYIRIYIQWLGRKTSYSTLLIKVTWFAIVKTEDFSMSLYFNSTNCEELGSSPVTQGK
jgi:hypothetical protein